MSEVDLNFYSRRAAEERQAAQAARDPRAAHSHAKLAERYEAVVRAYRPLMIQL